MGGVLSDVFEVGAEDAAPRAGGLEAWARELNVWWLVAAINLLTIDCSDHVSAIQFYC